MGAVIARYTDWYGTRQKPARPGVYQRMLPNSRIVYARWDGIRWMGWYGMRDLAARTKNPSRWQATFPWRGLDREVTL